VSKNLLEKNPYVHEMCNKEEINKKYSNQGNPENQRRNDCLKQSSTHTKSEGKAISILPKAIQHLQTSVIPLLPKNPHDAQWDGTPNITNPVSTKPPLPIGQQIKTLYGITRCNPNKQNTVPIFF
jgi:hypothetical protein